MANVPFIYVSVNVWRTLHPKTSVVPTLPVEMGRPLWFCVTAFLLLFLALLSLRAAARAAARADRRALSGSGRSVMRYLRVPCVWPCCCCPRSRARSRSPRPTSSCRSRKSRRRSRFPAITLVAAAYGFVWVAVFGYVWSLGRRLQAAEREIARLESKQD